jgi:nucleoside-diphosphate-sugar epimerase
MIAVTGYSGFIGVPLLAQLNEYECLLLGRKKPNANYPFFELHMTSANAPDIVKSLSKVTVLIHLAARVHVMNDSSINPLYEFRFVNTKGTLNLARQAAAGGVKRFIYLSSIKVNGESTSSRAPFTAFDDRLPEDLYALSKSEAEEELLAIGKKTGMEIVIIRPPLVYGEGVKANFASLMKLVGKGFPLPFRAVNRNKRSLVSVYNLVDLIGVCIDHPKAANQVFLVSDDNDLSTSQMVALMASVQGKANLSLPVPVWCFKILGKILKKETVVERLVGSLQLDIEHTKNTLDWAPPYSVEHGFKLAAGKH